MGPSKCVERVMASSGRSSLLLAMLLLVLVPSAALELHMVFGAHNVPHPAKGVGEDAFFFDDRLGTFGIADGVGGSAKNGVDPGAFSREVLWRVHQSALLMPGSSVFPLLQSLKIATEAPIDLGGSTTLVLGQLEARTDRLRVLNLGDSGAMLLRPHLQHFGPREAEVKVLFPRCVLRTQDQNHGWVSQHASL